MRIIAGSRGGRRLVEWEESGIRPMRDFVRAALFSILSGFVKDAAFLDLYCGTGSVGLEALSRGARSCTFVDRSRGSCAIARKNLDALDFLDVGEVVQGDTIETIEGFARRARRFDLIFLGPPYYKELAPVTLEALGKGEILAPDPIVVAEIHHTERADKTYGVLELVDARKYGDNRLLFYRPKNEADELGGAPRASGKEGGGHGRDDDPDHQ